MKFDVKKIVFLCAALALGGCETTTVSSPVTKSGLTVLKNPVTGKGYRCWFRERAGVIPAAAQTLEANYRSCVANARAAGYTHEVLVSRYP